MNNTSFGIWIFAPIGVFTAGFVYWIESVKWSSVERRVAFLEAAKSMKRC